MGKAADQRRRKRMKYFQDLAENHPVVFEKEWRKRVLSWAEQIQKDSGRLRDREGRQVMPVFQYVDDAIEILNSCGEDIFRKFAEETYDILNNECCVQVASVVDRRMYQPNNLKAVEHANWVRPKRKNSNVQGPIKHYKCAKEVKLLLRKSQNLSHVESFESKKPESSKKSDDKKEKISHFRNKEEHNHEVKSAMAVELNHMGLSKKFIARLLNIKF